MDFKDNIKNGARLAADAATDIAQALVSKSRLRANANRIRQVIKADTELKNQAYIELGRYYYENMRDSADEELENLCVVVDKTTARINKASKKYVELLNQSNDTKLKSENTEKIKTIVTDKAEKIKDSADATVAEIKDFAKDATKKVKDKATDVSDKVREKATDISDTVKEKTANVSSKVKEKATDIKDKAKDSVLDITDKAKDKVDDLKSFIAPEQDLDSIIEGDDELEQMIAQQQQIIAEAENALPADDEESPESFEF